MCAFSLTALTHAGPALALDSCSPATPCLPLNSGFISEAASTDYFAFSGNTIGALLQVYNVNGSTGKGVSGEAVEVGVRGRTLGTTHIGAGVMGEHVELSGASPGVYGKTAATAAQAAGVIGEVTTLNAGNFASGVRARNLATNNEGTGLWASHNGGGYGVYATSVGGPGVNGIHTAATGTQSGVQGMTFSATDLASGVAGSATANNPLATGVFGNAANGIGLLGVGGNIGVLGYHPTGGYAGYFVGNLHVQGTLSKAAGSFRIDHPLDPKTKYLQHSFVESPDMMNVYNGNIRTDRRGYATVKLPRYFGALNRDFRYQLTVVDRRHWDARAAIWQEVRGNRFVIRSEPNTKVSWQVTGIRKDPYANAHRIRPEIAKREVGTPSLLRAPLADALRRAERG